MNHFQVAIQLENTIRVCHRSGWILYIDVCYTFWLHSNNVVCDWIMLVDHHIRERYYKRFVTIQCYGYAQRELSNTEKTILRYYSAIFRNKTVKYERTAYHIGVGLSQN